MEMRDTLNLTFLAGRAPGVPQVLQSDVNVARPFILCTPRD